VNDPPSINSPDSVAAVEDTRFFFGSTLNITDPDQFDFGYDSILIEVNITITYGILYLNPFFVAEDAVGFSFLVRVEPLQFDVPADRKADERDGLKFHFNDRPAC
jgi:hypothetical protein